MCIIHKNWFNWKNEQYFHPVRDSYHFGLFIAFFEAAVVYCLPVIMIDCLAASVRQNPAVTLSRLFLANLQVIIALAFFFLSQREQIACPLIDTN